MLWNKNSSFFLLKLKKINNFIKNMQFERKLTYMEFDESRLIINTEFLSLYIFNPFSCLFYTSLVNRGCVLQNIDSIEIIILFIKKLLIERKIIF